MDIRKIHVIINPASGQDEPILSYLNGAFQSTDIDWDVSVTKRANDSSTIARELIGKTDLIAVYGGDGSITEVAQQLQGTSTPLAILPGGTANVISKELGIPQNTQQAIELIASRKVRVMAMDMGLCNGAPFMLRVNLGIMASMVMEADRELKNKVGQLAYGITALQTVAKSEPTLFTMTIDGKKIAETGVALTVTNCGSIGIGNYSFLPDISVTDGLLDVILLHEANLSSVLRIAGSTLLQSESEVLKHWKCKEVHIRLPRNEKLILDDIELEAQEINIRVVASTLKVIVPAT